MLHVKTREDYERVRKRPWPVGRKKTIVREDLIHDLQRGLLNFSFGTANVEDNNVEHCDGMLVAGNEPGVVRQVLLARPNLSSPEDCNVFKIRSAPNRPVCTNSENRDFSRKKYGT